MKLKEAFHFMRGGPDDIRCHVLCYEGCELVSCHEFPLYSEDDGQDVDMFLQKLRDNGYRTEGGMPHPDYQRPPFLASYQLPPPPAVTVIYYDPLDPARGFRKN